LTGDITPTRLRVLVLEDRPEDAQLLLYELRQSGYDPFWERVDTELDYLTALDDSFDLILADYSLPQFNAMEALKWLQKRKLDIPFIVVTGSISEEAAVETMKQGASDYLIKDRLGRLGQAVKQALVQKRLRDEKHKVDDALRVSEDRFRSLVQNLSDIITVHTKEGIITYVSPSITRILGYKPNSLMGKAPFEIIHPDDRERITRLFSGVVDGQSSDPAVEIRACRSDGNWIYLEAVATTLLEQDGAQAIVLTSRDITERKQAEEELQRANRELAAAYDATIEGWSRVLDLRDKEIEGHTQRVAEMAVRLARALGMPDEEVVHLRRGALLHDIGKMAISDHILQKPGPLTVGEWAEMRKHPEYAYQMLFPITHLRPALDIPYCHHERWDGSGYPRGLSGEQIPLAARIFAIVDVWDALSSNRPYRKRISVKKALAHIRENEGAHFEPALAEKFLSMVDRIINP
jgi:PAS domain S-box-containing protein/putative nucleotidyltransferase with HDIG domain